MNKLFDVEFWGQVLVLGILLLLFGYIFRDPVIQLALLGVAAVAVSFMDTKAMPSMRRSNKQVPIVPMPNCSPKMLHDEASNKLVKVCFRDEVAAAWTRPGKLRDTLTLFLLPGTCTALLYKVNSWFALAGFPIEAIAFLVTVFLDRRESRGAALLLDRQEQVDRDDRGSVPIWTIWIVTAMGLFWLYSKTTMPPVALFGLLLTGTVIVGVRSELRDYKDKPRR